jgi:hypothetical protein
MDIAVEPITGPSLDRLVTALLNATGVCHRVIEESKPDAAGMELIGLVAARLRDGLSLLAEHRSDHELELATQVLAQVTLLVAAELGLDHLHRPGAC